MKDLIQNACAVEARLTNDEVDSIVFKHMEDINSPEGNPIRKLNAYRALVRSGEDALRTALETAFNDGVLEGRMCERNELQPVIDAAQADAANWRAYKARKDAVIAAGMGRNPLRSEFPQPQRQDVPCGECHLEPGETCDICGAKDAQGAKP